MKKSISLLVFFLAFSMLNAQPFKKMDAYKDYLLKNANTIDKIEGIWEISKTLDTSNKENGSKYKSSPYLVAIIKMGFKKYKTFAVNERRGTIEEDTDSSSVYWFKSKSRKGKYFIINCSTCDNSYEDMAYMNASGELHFSEKSKQIENYLAQKDNSASNVFVGKSNVVEALQGKVSGVQVTNSGAQVGSGSSVVIRGYNSLIGNNQPLYIVDGVPIDNTSDVGPSNLNGYPSANRAIDINADNIESVTVLKGGAATALYGIQASNGAIVITTKQGKRNSGFNYSVASWNYFSIKARKVF